MNKVRVAILAVVAVVLVASPAQAEPMKKHTKEAVRCSRQVLKASIGADGFIRTGKTDKEFLNKTMVKVLGRMSAKCRTATEEMLLAYKQIVAPEEKLDWLAEVTSMIAREYEVPLSRLL